ncbi:MAG: hypothetical protein MUF21_04345 [Gemmatimonadaceae bacterium]|jgi:hypothetical protein|nr:hypothetical protein [Gemmatimonadaceae bacterium]
MARRATVPPATAPGSAGALIALFTSIADRWQLTTGERCRLLGEIGRTTLWDWTRGHAPRALSFDTRERIAHCVGIDVALARFYGAGSPLAVSHLRRPRTAPDGAHAAIDVMLGGLPGLAAVRRQVEALGGGALVATLPASGRAYELARPFPDAPRPA